MTREVTNSSSTGIANLGLVNEMGIKPRAVRRVDAMKSEFERQGWRSTFCDVANFMIPRRGVFLRQEGFDPNQGWKMDQNVNNGVAQMALEEASAGMMHGFTSPSQPWLQIVPADIDLAGFKPVREYLYRQQLRMMGIFERSNLYDTLPMVYQELNAFGNAALRVDFDMERTVHFTQHTIGSYYFANGLKDEVDTVPHMFVRTVRQLVQEYGPDGVSRDTRRKNKEGDLDDWVKCWNLVEVNSDQDRNRIDWRGMPYRSITWEEGSDKDELLKVRGFELFPTLTPRGRRVPNDTYAGGNGFTALADTRELQRLESSKKEALSKTLRPPLNSFGNKKPTTVAGEFNHLKSGSTPTSPTFTVNMPYGEVLNEQVIFENRIRRTMGADLFNLFADLDSEGRRTMTATEVAERRAEKLSRFGPMQQSVHNGLLRPLVQTTWIHMGRSGQLEEPPPELAGIDLKVEFISQLALAQSGVIRNDTEAFVDRIALIDQAIPGTLDNLDGDLIARELANGYLINPKLLRDPGAVDEIRQAQADLAAQQSQQQAELDQSQALRNLGGASVAPDSALGALTEA